MSENYAVKEIEKARKKIQLLDRAQILLVIYMFFIPIIHMVVSKKTTIDSRSPEAFLMGAEYVGGFICMMIMFQTCSKELNKIKKLYKEGFVTAVLSERIPGATYRGGKGFLESRVKNFGIVDMGNLFRSEDYIRAEYKGISYEHADVLIEETYPRAISNTIFKGRMIRYRGLPRRISYLSIYSHNFGRPKGKFKEWKNPETGEAVFTSEFTCKDKDFDSKFEVYAINDRELLALITPKFVELLKKLLERYSSMGLIFEEDRLYVAFNTKRDTFDVELARKVDLQKEKERICRDIQDIEDIVDALTAEN